jgi:hypothetical protein
MRSGGKGMWGRGPVLYKHNYLKKYISTAVTCKQHLFPIEEFCI